METTNATTLEESLDADVPNLAHYAEASAVTEGYILGKAVLAICGAIFVPSRDPLKYPICPNCKELLDTLFIEED